jgi:hypothetical protein
VSFQESPVFCLVLKIIFVFFVFHNLSDLIYFFSFSKAKAVSHIIKGFRYFSMDQLSSLKSEALSILKRESKEVLALKLKGDDLLYCSKNSSFLSGIFMAF